MAHCQRSSLDAPVAVAPNYFQDKTGNSTLKVTWYYDNDMKSVASVKSDTEINRTFVGGAQPDESVPANQPFSVVWEVTYIHLSQDNIYWEWRRTVVCVCMLTDYN